MNPSEFANAAGNNNGSAKILGIAGILLIVFVITSSYCSSFDNGFGDNRLKDQDKHDSSINEDHLDVAKLNHNITLERYNTLIKNGSTEPSLFNTRGEILSSSQAQDTIRLALNDFNEAIKIDNSVAAYYLNRGSVYARLGSVKLAIKDLNRCIKLDPNLATPYLIRSEVYSQSGEFDKALADLLKYKEYGPISDTLMFKIARLYRNLGELDLALVWYDQAILNNTDDGRYYHDRAKLYFLMGNRPSAQQDIRRAQELGFRVSKTVLDRIMN